MHSNMGAKMNIPYNAEKLDRVNSLYLEIVADRLSI